MHAKPSKRRSRSITSRIVLETITRGDAQRFFISPTTRNAHLKPDKKRAQKPRYRQIRDKKRHFWPDKTDFHLPDNEKTLSRTPPRSRGRCQR